MTMKPFVLAGATIVVVALCWLPTSSSFGLLFELERFRPACPADPSSIRQLEPTLIDDDLDADSSNKGVWVAVYRSNQNKPSIVDNKSSNREDFMNAMKIATTPEQQSQLESSWSNLLETPMALEKPVAVAQLKPSDIYDGKFVLGSLRCGLKKEDQDEDCDGGSEYLEALSVAIDTLLVHHLSKEDCPECFDIRTKGTLFSQHILESRGFAPVEELSRDMATHVSDYEYCLASYTKRASEESLSPAARDRALQIASLLGRLDKEKQQSSSSTSDGNDDDTYDPWANINLRR